MHAWGQRGGGELRAARRARLQESGAPRLDEAAAGVGCLRGPISEDDAAGEVAALPNRLSVRPFRGFLPIGHDSDREISRLAVRVWAAQQTRPWGQLKWTIIAGYYIPGCSQKPGSY